MMDTESKGRLHKGNQTDTEAKSGTSGMDRDRVTLNSEVTSIDRNSAFKGTQLEERKLKRLQDLRGKIQTCILAIYEHVCGVFMSPLVKDPIYFSLPESGMAKVSAAGCAYETATRELIDGVFEERKEKIKGKDAHHFRFKVNLEKYPGWDQTTIDQLREEFQFFDKSNQGLVSFENMSKALDLIGNKSTNAERRSHFDMIDTDHSGFIDFREFCTMMYNLNHSQEEFFSDVLYDLYKAFDRDLMSIPNLTVLQQLQSGLF